MGEIIGVISLTLAVARMIVSVLQNSPSSMTYPFFTRRLLVSTYADDLSTQMMQLSDGITDFLCPFQDARRTREMLDRPRAPFEKSERRNYIFRQQLGDETYGLFQRHMSALERDVKELASHLGINVETTLERHRSASQGKIVMNKLRVAWHGDSIRQLLDGISKRQRDIIFLLDRSEKLLKPLRPKRGQKRDYRYAGVRRVAEVVDETLHRQWPCRCREQGAKAHTVYIRLNKSGVATTIGTDGDGFHIAVVARNSPWTPGYVRVRSSRSSQSRDKSKSRKPKLRDWCVPTRQPNGTSVVSLDIVSSSDGIPKDIKTCDEHTVEPCSSQSILGDRFESLRPGPRYSIASTLAASVPVLASSWLGGFWTQNDIAITYRSIDRTMGFSLYVKSHSDQEQFDPVPPQQINNALEPAPVTRPRKSGLDLAMLSLAIASAELSDGSRMPGRQNIAGMVRAGKPYAAVAEVEAWVHSLYHEDRIRPAIFEAIHFCLDWFAQSLDLPENTARLHEEVVRTFEEQDEVWNKTNSSRSARG